MDEVDLEVTENETIPATEETTPPPAETPEPKEDTEPPAREQGAPKTEPEVPAPGAEAAVTEPEAFTPNFKYKAFRKEHEIPELFRSLIKDKKSEEEVHKLFSRAAYMDETKPKLEQIEQERAEVQQQNSIMRAEIGDAKRLYTKAIQTGNLLHLDHFFNKLEIPEEVVLQYALTKAKLRQLPPEQQHAALSQVSAEKQADDLHQASSQTANQLRSQAIQIKNILVDQRINSADLKPLVEQFDERVGKAGAFREAVFREGLLEWHSSGQKVDLPPEEAVKRVLKNYGIAPSEGGTQTPNPAAQTQGKPPASTQAPVTRTTRTIPNVQGKAGSPLKTGPDSLDDLKKLRDSYAAS